MKPSVVAVFDVGKTNKKLSAYDRSLNVLAEERTTLEVKERDGLEVEATDELLDWFQGALASVAPRFDVRAVAVTAHGATCALLDAEGQLAYPVVSYTTDKDDEIHDEFYEVFGDPDTLHRLTCTPDLGFANIAKSLYYLKTRMPEVWERCAHALFYNGYLGYELTGRFGLEHTYLGNHNYLWDFHEKTWSSVARKLGVDRMFPEAFSNPWDELGPIKPELAESCGVPGECRVTMGIHDSNANFLPYLAKGYENFILNSTGTWCVVMSQAEKPELTGEEIRAKVLYNLDAFGNPLKTSIFPGGLEYETFGSFTEVQDQDDFDAIRRVLAGKELFVVPGVLPAASPFPGTEPGVVQGGQRHPLDSLEPGQLTGLGQDYRAALNISLAIATCQLLERCGAKQGTTVFIEGGFANNKSYCALLAALCPGYEIALTNMKEGTSFGAAITGWMVAEELPLEKLGEDFTIETHNVSAGDFPGLDEYENAFMKSL